MDPYSPEAFFDLAGSPAADLFKGLTRVWEAVAALPAYIEKILQPEIKGEIEEGAWVDLGRVRLMEGSKVERGAVVRGPTIIGRNTIVRSHAYIRGHVMVGDGCMIGHSTELRQTLVLNRTNVPHYNGVFTTLIGSGVLIGGYTTTANFLLTGKEIDIRVPEAGEIKSYPTGLTLFGAVVGDGAKVGAMSILLPGTLIGRRCLIHPKATLSGYLPPESLVRPKASTYEVVPRPQK